MAKQISKRNNRPGRGYKGNPLRPYQVYISSKDKKREKFLGTFPTVRAAFDKGRGWQSSGKQASGCVLYVRNRFVATEYILRRPA